MSDRKRKLLFLSGAIPGGLAVGFISKTTGVSAILLGIVFLAVYETALLPWAMLGMSWRQLWKERKK
jgi:hypothetical protein